MTFSSRQRTVVIAGILVLLGIAIVITPWYIFPVCEAKGMTSHSMFEKMGDNQAASMASGMLMKCGYTARAEAAVGIIVILAGLVLFAQKARKYRKVLGGAIAGFGILAILIPTVLIGVCNAPDAPCRIGTLPALILLGALTIVAGAIVVLTHDEIPKETH